MNYKPIIIVAGEPNSIFFELFFKVIKKKVKSPIILIASKKLITKQAKILKKKINFRVTNEFEIIKKKNNLKRINLIDVDFNQSLGFGKITPKSNNYIKTCFEIAIKLLKNNNISYYKDRECFLDDNIVWCNYSIFHGNERPDIEEAKVKFGDDKKYIGLYHAPIIGSKTDLGYTLDHGANVDHFNGLDACLLGDIHKKQVITLTDNNKNIKLKFPGSLVQQGFGENISGHGYTIWDVETLDDEHVEINSDASFFQYQVTNLDQLDDKSYKLINK